MSPSSKTTTAIVLLCRRDGELVDVLYDDIGLPAATRFESYLAAFDRRKAKRFLEAAVGKMATLDRKLNVVTAAGTVPLFFSAASSRDTLVVVATRGHFETGQPPPGLAHAAAGHASTMRVAFRKLDARKRQQAASLQSVRGRRQIARVEAGTAQLLRLIVHDLTNPISGILAASHFLIEDVGHVLDVHQRTLLKSIESSAEFALQFIEGMLELHLMKAGKLHLRLEPTDVARLAAECTESCRRRARYRRIALESQSIGPVPVADLDRQHGAQAITALIRDELENLGPGSTVHVTASARKDGAEIVIAGEGARLTAGAAKAPREDVRGAPSKGRLSEIRTALTLSAVSRIAEAHRGSVRKEDRSPGRPTFKIRFPASAQPTSERKAPPRK
jgi:K+-sensing histidine kinase KdpD